MKIVKKTMAAIMLMAMVVFTVGCNNDSSKAGGKNGDEQSITKGDNGNNGSTEIDNSTTKPQDDAKGRGGDGSYNGHDYVDLGLPSGTLWATCNVGATKPEEYGDYFAWGETKQKTIYNLNTYRYCNNGDEEQLTKYCNNFEYGYHGFTDNLTVLQPEDDAATMNWGSGWSTPTEEQWEELLENTDNAWKTWDGVEGRLFAGKNGTVLFLPAASFRWGSELNYAGSIGDYWSRSLDTDNPGRAWGLGFYSGDCGVGNYNRSSGQSVRPVRSARQN